MGCRSSKEADSDDQRIAHPANRPLSVPLGLPTASRAANEFGTEPPIEFRAPSGLSTSEVVPSNGPEHSRLNLENDSTEGLSSETAAYIRELARHARENGKTTVDLGLHVESGHIRQEELNAAAAAKLREHRMKSSGLELQVALDSFFTGDSERHLIEFFAREGGFDPARARLVITPWDGSEKDLQSSELRKVTKIEGGFDEVSGSQKKWEALHQRHQSLAKNQQDDLGDAGMVSTPSGTSPGPQGPMQLPALQYEYSNLSRDHRQIRLLMCTPSKDDPGHANLELRTFDLDDAPEFYALSYVWGTEGLQVGIICDGRKMSLTRTLASALQRVVPWSPGVPLWADAICINQNNLAERNHQVSMMGDIYRRASKVLAHLGRPVEEAGKSDPDWSAMSLMSYFNKLWNVDKTIKARSEQEWMTLGIPNASDTEVWSRLIDFWMQPWFRRCWVLQEAALGREVVIFYGNAIKNLSAIVQFLDHAQQQDLPSVLKYGHLADAYVMGQKIANVGTLSLVRKSESTQGATGSDAEQNKPFRKSLLNLLILSRSNAATDPRDKVYGLLGLAEDDIAKQITPDYSTECSAAKLYIEVAQAYIRSGEGVKLLQHAGIDSVESAAFRRKADIADPVAGLPSWVPDWSQKPRHKFEHELYNSSRSSEPKIRLAENEVELIIRGAIIDTVKMEGLPLRYSVLNGPTPKFHYYKRGGPGFTFPGGMTDVEIGRTVYTLAIVLSRKYCSLHAYPSGADLSLIARTLIADTMQTGRRVTSAALNTSGNAYHRWAEWVGNLPQSDTEGGPAEFLRRNQHEETSGQDHMVDEAWPFAAALERTQRGRRLCWTERGYIGTATHDTEEGDLIVLFEGFRMPFVLRRKEDKFQIVGDCYVHGIMDGELMCLAGNADTFPPGRLSIGQDGTKYCIGLGNKELATFQDFVIV